MSSGFAEGSAVFVRVGGGRLWESGRVIDDKSVAAGSLTVSVGAGPMPKRQTVQLNDLVAADETQLSVAAQNTSDMKGDAPVTEAAVLDLIRRRVAAGSLFTQVGDQVVSVVGGGGSAGYENPLQYLSIPSNNIQEQDEIACKVVDGTIQPHVFKLANRALRQLLRDVALDRSSEPSQPQKQTILLYGESGSGKSFSTRHIVRFLIAADAKIAEGKQPATMAEKAKQFTQAADQAEIVLQSFGSCVTSTGKNSSRYVGRVECSYDGSKELKSVSFKPVLLETSRLQPTGVAAGERSFNVLYQLIAGGDAKLKESLFIPSGSPQDAIAAFPLFSAGGSGMGFDQAVDAAGFVALCDALGPKGANCSPEEIGAIWSTLGAVLHLSTAETTADGATFSSTSIPNLSSLLGFEEGHFVDFIKSPFKKDHEKYGTALFRARCVGLASALYEGALTFILDKISKRSSSGAPAPHILSVVEVSSTIIGNADGKASLDQLFLNTICESVQQMYFSRFFSEPASYANVADCKNNSSVHDLLLLNNEGSRGILGVIDAIAPKTIGDEPYLFKGGFEKEPFVSTHSNFQRVDGKFDAFTVKHSGSKSVRYSTVGMQGDNNNEVIRGGAVALMEFWTSNASIKAIVSSCARRESAVQTVRALCDSLLSPIFAKTSSPLIVHCMRPHAGDASSSAHMLEQITRGGSDLVHLAASRAAGYPISMTKETFLKKFQSIANDIGAILASVAASEGSRSTVTATHVSLKDDGTVEKLLQKISGGSRAAAIAPVGASTAAFASEGAGRKDALAVKLHALKVAENFIKTPTSKNERGPSTPQDQSAEKIQRLIRRFTNKSRVQTLHSAIEAGDVQKVKTLLTAHPEDVRTVNKANEYCTVHHSALKGGSLQMLQVLGLRPIDVIFKDAGDHTSAHYAVLNPNITALQLLNKCLSQCHIPDAEGRAAASELLTAKKSGSGTGSAGKTQGWLHKYSQGQWLRRWFVVDDRGLSYYHDPGAANADHKPSDTYPLSKKLSLYSRSYYVENTIIVNTSQRSYVKNRGVLVLKAESELVTQEWLVALSRVSYIEPFREGFLRYRNVDLCTSWLKEVTWAEETALHTLARSVYTPAVGDKQVATAAWLIEHGCPVNAVNYEGKTALHLAIINNNETLAFGLFKKGASLSIKDNSSKLPLDCASFVLQRLFQSYGTDAVKHMSLRYPLLAAPEMTYGYTYVSLFFQHQTLGVFEKTGKSIATKHPVLTVSLHRPDDVEIETPQDICATVYSDPENIWWGYTVHLQVRRQLRIWHCSIRLLNLTCPAPPTPHFPPPDAFGAHGSLLVLEDHLRRSRGNRRVAAAESH